MKINLRNKKKWLLSCSCNPKKALTSNQIAELSKNVDLYLTKYDQLLFLSNFNAGVEDSSVKNFCSSFNLTSMINKPICYKIWGSILGTNCVFSKEVEALIFLVIFNIIISYIFPENFIEIQQVVQNLSKFSSSILTIFAQFFGFFDIYLLQKN